MFGDKEKLTKDEILQLKSAAKDIASFREEIKSFRTLVDSIDRRTNPAAMVDPERARKEVVEAIAALILSDKEELIKQVRETAIERLTEGVDIDTSNIEDSLSQSDKLVGDVINKLDIDKIKSSIVDSAADKIIEDNLDIDDVSSSVAEKISERLEVRLSEPE